MKDHEILVTRVRKGRAFNRHQESASLPVCTAFLLARDQLEATMKGKQIYPQKLANNFASF